MKYHRDIGSASMIYAILALVKPKKIKGAFQEVFKCKGNNNTVTICANKL